VLVWPDIFGLRPAFRQMGRRLAESGYSVLVVNPFYRQKKAPTAPQGGQTPIAEVMPLMQALTPAMHLSDGKAFVPGSIPSAEVDKARKLGTTGYCMGGPIAVRTATVAPGRVGAVGTFHGAAMVTPAPDSPHRLVAQTQARYLIAVAENDDRRTPKPRSPAHRVRQREAAGRGGGVPGRPWLVPARHAGLRRRPIRARLGAAAGDVRHGTGLIFSSAARPAADTALPSGARRLRSSTRRGAGNPRRSRPSQRAAAPSCRSW
jgi:dienelactone hydrolase